MSKSWSVGMGIAAIAFAVVGLSGLAGSYLAHWKGLFALFAIASLLGYASEDEELAHG